MDEPNRNRGGSDRSSQHPGSSKQSRGREEYDKPDSGQSSPGSQRQGGFQPGENEEEDENRGSGGRKGSSGEGKQTSGREGSSGGSHRQGGRS